MTETTRKDLTSGDIRKYIRFGGLYCPYCGSAKIEGEGGEVGGETYSQSILCKHCNKRWYDMYKLYDIQEEVEDGVYQEDSVQE